ncbi:glycerate kinase [Thalassotalea psychrophila]|uniref:Glycerate kinase n=1 Tax=Thalassotalea psychrophila TaxID=3065647 RepID=A0ABY9TUS1_9GAMM|nr:glycerate kinase [Colwelliaceae bacterium SQ149]
MKVVIAPDSFKESLTALEVANAIELGFKRVFPDAEYIKVPMADGGEGTVQALVDATNGKIVCTPVKGPLHAPVDSFYGILGDGETAVIEMAAASGLHQINEDEKDAKLTCSFGTGQLIIDALDKGVSKFIIGLGGSATNDAGAGMLTALGANLTDKNSKAIPSGGANLHLLHHIDLANLHPKFISSTFLVACDVSNPLCGDNGASAVFGPQKGASTQDIALLDANLLHFGQKLETLCQKSIINFPGSGAAGGMGASLLAICNAKLQSGVELVTNTLALTDKVEGADLVITGEGRIDSQTVFGKTPIGVADVAKQHNCPVIVIAGSVRDDYDVVFEHGIDAVFPILSEPGSLAEALTKGATNIERTAYNIAKTINITT